MNSRPIIKRPIYNGDQKENVFDLKTTIAALSYLLKLNDYKADFYYIIKSLYLIERKSLVETGKPMFYDKLYSLPLGPVTSIGYDKLKEIRDRKLLEGFATYSSVDRTIQIKTPLYQEYLSEHEKGLIEEVHSYVQSTLIRGRLKNGRRSDISILHDMMMELPEYEKIESGNSPIYYETILSGEGLSNKAIERIIEEVNTHQRMRAYCETW